MKMRDISLSLSTSAFLSIGLILSSFQASAQANPPVYFDADYVSFFSGSFIKSQGTKALDSLFKNLNYSVPQLNLGSSPTVSLNQVNIQITPATYKIADTATGITFKATGNTVSVSIGSVSVNQVIQQNLGGIIVNVQINASCQGVTAQVADPNSVISGDLAPLETGNLLSIQLSNAVVQLGNPQFGLNAIQCTGAQGFEQVISTTIQSALTNSNLLSQIIQNDVIASAQQAMGQVTYDWTQPQLMFASPYNNGLGGVQAWVYPTYLQGLSTGSWQSSGTIRFVMPFNTAPKKTHFPLNPADYSSYSNQNVFIVSDAVIPALVQNYFAPGLWSYAGLANSISAFKSLLDSRFLEFFFWGDLMNWPKSTLFPMVAKTSQVGLPTWNSDGSLALQAEMNIDMWANAEPYMHFKVPLKADLAMNITNKQLIFSTNDAGIKINYAFDPNYCAGGKGRCGRIASNLITNGVQKYLNTQTQQLPIPVMQIVGGGKVQATSVSRRPDLKAFVVVFGD